MKCTLKKSILAAVAALVIQALPSHSLAENFPSRPITLVVPTAPGGSHDLTARALATVAEKYLGQPVLVELKPGGNGAVGSNFVANAAPDGYTLLFGGPAFNTTPPLLENRPNLGPDGFATVARINFTPQIIAARVNTPYKTFSELLAWAKANPGQLKAAGGRGSGIELFLRFVAAKTGITFRSIPYDGGGAVLNAILGGHADVASGVPAALAPHEKAGKIWFAVITADERSRLYPNVPTAKESGIDYTYVFWRGVLAPKGTPRPIIDKLADAFHKMAQDPAVRSVLEGWGDGVDYLGPDEFGKWWRAEYDFQRDLLKNTK
jgi:tripartite-type tricarboxylate transporter receptor subunit TctC